jgi:hypothetical protein
VARVLIAAWFSLGLSLSAPVGAGAAASPFQTVVGPVVPAIAGLSLSGAAGECDLLLLNQTGQDVVLLDDGSQTHKYPTAAKAPARPAAVPVHLTGNWKCSGLVAATEELAWNNVPVSVVSWTLRGQVGAQAFRAVVQTVYDPTLDPMAGMLGYLRPAAGVLAVGVLVAGVPYLLWRRRQILDQ